MDKSSGWTVYILQCADGTLYTGITTDVERRIREHEGGGGSGAKYLRGRTPVSLACQFAVADRSVASRLEYRIKNLSRVDKLALISGNLELATLLQADKPDSVEQ